MATSVAAQQRGAILRHMHSQSMQFEGQRSDGDSKLARVVDQSRKELVAMQMRLEAQVQEHESGHIAEAVAHCQTKKRLEETTVVAGRETARANSLEEQIQQLRQQCKQFDAKLTALQSQSLIDGANMEDLSRKRGDALRDLAGARDRIVRLNMQMTRERVHFEEHRKLDELRLQASQLVHRRDNVDTEMGALTGGTGLLGGLILGPIGVVGGLVLGAAGTYFGTNLPSQHARAVGQKNAVLRQMANLKRVGLEGK